MPMKPKRPCRHPFCKNLTDDRRGFCELHRGSADNLYARQRTDTAEQKLYSSVRWRKLRAAKLAENPFCEICRAAGRVAVASIVHHVVEVRQGGDPYDFAGLQAVCASCHRRIHGGGRR